MRVTKRELSDGEALLQRCYLYDEECICGIECSECGWQDVWDSDVCEYLPEECPSCGRTFANVLSREEQDRHKALKDTIINGKISQDAKWVDGVKYYHQMVANEKRERKKRNERE